MQVMDTDYIVLDLRVNVDMKVLKRMKNEQENFMKNVKMLVFVILTGSSERWERRKN